MTEAGTARDRPHHPHRRRRTGNPGFLQKVFERESLRALTARGGAEALEILRREPVSILLTDLVMPGMSGLDLLKASRSISPETETILMTAYGTVENAVEAMRQRGLTLAVK